MFIELNDRDNTILNLNSISTLCKRTYDSIIANNVKVYEIYTGESIIYNSITNRDKDYERILDAIRDNMYVTL